MFPSSAYVSGIIAATLDCALDGDAIITKTLSLGILQRVVAAQRFYGSTHDRVSNILDTKKSDRKFQDDCPK